MILNTGCNITVEVQGTVPLNLILKPQSGAAQHVQSSQVSFEPFAPVTEWTDAFGNLCQRAILVTGTTTIQASATVEVPDFIDIDPGAPLTPPEDLPPEVMQFLLPSRYCQSDLFQKQATSITSGEAPGFDQVEAIRRWVNRKLKYRYGVSDSSTSAVETEKKRRGICRDYAHLGIALTRAVIIPARMVFGYLHELNPMDLHAWFEAYVNGRWYTFDATQKEEKGNRVIVAYGRDAADTAQMTFYGPLQVTQQNVWVNPA
ncbi:MAG: transglutaminase domain-containing protein [Roseimicrobium sp.]